MSSNPNHPYSDYLCDIFMEIHPTFYPPPTVSIPNVDIPRPSLSSYQYTFKRERTAIAAYDKEQERRREELERQRREQEERLRNLPKQELTAKMEDFPATSQNSMQMESEKLKKPMMHQMKRPDEILQPSRVVHMSSTSKAETSQAGTLRPINGLEEFETITNVFDLMEIRSLDDRAELERLLISKPLTTSSSQPEIQNGAAAVAPTYPQQPTPPILNNPSPTTTTGRPPPYSIGSIASVPSILPSYGSSK